MRRKKANLLRISFSGHRDGAGGQRFSIALLLSAFLGVFWEKQTTLMMTDANELYDMTISLALLFFPFFTSFFYSSYGPNRWTYKDFLDIDRCLL